MDPITSAVTLVALVTTTRKVLVTTFKICKAMNDAPDDVLKISRQVDFVTTFLEQMIAVEERFGHNRISILPQKLQEMLQEAVLAIIESLEELVQTCQARSGKLGLHTRLRWALLKKSEATTISQSLRTAMADLSHVIQLLQLQFYCVQIHEMNDGQLSRAKTAHLAQSIHDTTSETCNTPRAWQLEESSTISRITEHAERGDNEQLSLESARSGEHRGQHLITRSYRALPLLDFILGASDPRSSGMLTCEWDQFKTTYGLSMYLRLPDFLGRRALIIDFAVRQPAIYWTGLSLRNGTISLSNLVTCQSEIWKACVSGDEGAVRGLMNARLASPFDTFDRCTCETNWGDSHDRNFTNGDTVLAAAITSGNFSLVQYLVDIGANVNAQTVHLRSCLHRAVQHNHLAIARLLVNQGASADHVDIFGLGALHFLRESTNPPKGMTEAEWNEKIGIPFLDFMSALSIEDFNRKGQFGGSALEMFAWSGAFGIFSRALKLGASARIEQSLKTDTNDTILHQSAFGGSFEILEIVLNDNPDMNVNQQNFNGKTPLHSAFMYGNSNVASVELLLNRGADVNIRDNYGRTPLFNLVSWSELTDSVAPILNLLLKHGASLSAVDCLGNTLLHYAARYGRTTWMEYLLKQGCGVNARNVNNVTPLHYAEIRHGFPYHSRAIGEYRAEVRRQALTEVVKLLFASGADPQIIGRFLYLPLHDLRTPICVDSWWKAPPLMETSYIYLTPTSLARIYLDKGFSLVFDELLGQYYPGTRIDSDGDVFWESSEHWNSPGEGSEMVVVNYRHEELGEAQLLEGIWNAERHYLYDKAMLIKDRVC
ncbi:hypothetical protein MMC11_005742 [Xylographa trunciseda]|nr:hypothetical protein [Xylographa trunciseda]